MNAIAVTATNEWNNDSIHYVCIYVNKKPDVCAWVMVRTVFEAVFCLHKRYHRFSIQCVWICEQFTWFHVINYALLNRFEKCDLLIDLSWRHQVCEKISFHNWQFEFVFLSISSLHWFILFNWRQIKTTIISVEELTNGSRPQCATQ